MSADEISDGFCEKSEFEKAIIRALDAERDGKQHDETHVVVVYDAGSLIECALAAVVHSTHVISALPEHCDYDLLADEVIKCDPECVILFNNRWHGEFLEKIAKERKVVSGDVASTSQDSYTKNAVVIVLIARTEEQMKTDQEIAEPTKEESTKPEWTRNIICVSPVLFQRMVQSKNSAAAACMYNYIMRGSFPQCYASSDAGLRGKMFMVALRSLVNAPFEAFTMLDNITKDWKRVLEPDELVNYGKYISGEVRNMVRANIREHGCFIKTKIGDNDEIYRVCCTTDYHSETLEVMREPIPNKPINGIMVYTLSADTTTVSVAAEHFNHPDAMSMLADISSHVCVSGSHQRVKFAADDFFKYIRSHVILLKDINPTEEAKVIAEIEKEFLDQVKAAK